MTDSANRENATEPVVELRPTNQTVRDLIAICTSLIDLLGRETGLLEAMRPAEIRGLQDQKSTLALTYEQQVQQLASDPTCLRAVEPVLRDELKTALNRLESSRRANEQALRASREANERVIRAIVSAVGERQQQAATYGPDGAQAVGRTTHADDTISLSVNRQI